MAIPEFQQYLLPLLNFCSDGKEHVISDAIDHIASLFKLREKDLKELVPSGKDSRHGNRVKWAKTYLTKAGLLSAPSRGKFIISQEGKRFLKTNPQSLSIKSLLDFPKFHEFRHGKGQTSTEVLAGKDTTHTPEEILESSYGALRESLASELLERTKKCSYRFFENLVVALLLAMGYGGSRKDAGSAIGKSGDGGIDGVIKEDKLGLDTIYIQAKRWDSTVERPIVQAFAGSLMGQKAHKGIIITTSRFSNDAITYAKNIEKKIVLIDGNDLVQLMIDYDIGVSQHATYVVKKFDSDFFEEQ